MPSDYGNAIEGNPLVVQMIFASRNPYTSDLELNTYIDKDSYTLLRKVMNWTEVRTVEWNREQRYFRRQECDFSDFGLTVQVPAHLPLYRFD
jgi:hypothetical protein